MIGKSSEQGYSLVEFLVAAGLMGFIGYLGSQLWVKNNQFSAKMRAEGQTKESLNTVMQRIRRAAYITAYDSKNPISPQAHFLASADSTSEISFRDGFLDENGDEQVTWKLSNVCTKIPENLRQSLPRFDAKYFENEALSKTSKLLSAETGEKHITDSCVGKVLAAALQCAEDETMAIRLEYGTIGGGGYEYWLPKAVHNKRLDATSSPVAGFARAYKSNYTSHVILYAATFKPESRRAKNPAKRLQWHRLKTTLPPAANGMSDYLPDTYNVNSL